MKLSELRKLGDACAVKLQRTTLVEIQCWNYHGNRNRVEYIFWEELEGHKRFNNPASIKSHMESVLNPQQAEIELEE